MSDDKRTYCVSVRLNKKEAEALDKMRIRGKKIYQRGEYVRLVLFNNTPPIVPEINKEAWAKLSKFGSNLNQLAKKLNIGENIEIEKLINYIKAVRNDLLKTDLFEIGEKKYERNEKDK